MEYGKRLLKSRYSCNLFAYLWTVLVHVCLSKVSKNISATEGKMSEIVSNNWKAALGKVVNVKLKTHKNYFQQI